MKERHYGKRLLDIKTAWKTATRKARLSGILIHDTRRSAVRNMLKAGVDQAVVMRISGHKTPSVFNDTIFSTKMT